jgi:SAM-dependent methyltransferase
MTEYDQIAVIYDDYTDGFDYGLYLDKIFAKAQYLPRKGLALDCGCGTGTLITELEKRGYSCTGVDISPEMLETAAEKITQHGFEPHLVCQSLENIDLYGAYDICFCTLDTINHLSEKQLTRFFGKLIYFTEPGGYFIFDVKTEAMMKRSAQLRVIDKDSSTLILDGVFSKNRLTNYITVFSEENGVYERYDTVIKENLYKKNELQTLLKNSGFTPVAVFSFKGREIYISQNKRTFYDFQENRA